MDNYSSSTLSSKENWVPFKIAGLYLLIGGLWILFSDQLATQMTSDPVLLTRISLYKGWVYVLATALLLYWLIRREITALRGGNGQLGLIIDALPALISYVDADRRYQFSNKAYEDWFGHEASGKHLEEVLGTVAYKTISGYVGQVLKGETVTYETEIPYKDGGTRFVNTTYVPDSGTNGKVKGFFAFVQDVTESKQAEEELRQWADAFDGCAHGIAIDDPSTNRITVCNSAFARMHKSRVEDIVGTAILSLYSPPDHEHVRRSIEKADQIGHSRFEAHMIRRDGSAYPVQMDVVSVWGDNGDLLHRVATAVDVTERKGTEEALRESEKNARSLLRLSKRLELAQTYSEALDAALEEVKSVLGYQNVWMYLLSEDKQYLRLLTITGGKSQMVTEDFPTLTIKGDRFLEEIAYGKDIVLVEDARIDPRTNKDIVAQLGNRTIVNVPIILMDTHLGAFGTGSFGEEGVRIPTPAQLDYLRALASHMAVTLDRIHLLAKRKQAEEKIGYQAYLLENVNDAIIGSDENSVLTFWNHAAEKMFGWSAEEMLGLSAREILRSEFINTDRETTLRTLATARNWQGEALQYRKDGTQVISEIHSIALHNTNGSVTGYVSVIRDITARKQVEEALRASEAKFKTLFETMSEGFAIDEIICDEAGKPRDLRYLELNPAFEDHTGLKGADIVGHTTLELFPDAEPMWFERYGKVALTGEPAHFEAQFGPLGRWFKVSAYQTEPGRFATVFFDITELKQAEEALQRAHDELEFKVQERTAALSQANILLQALMDYMPDHIYFKDIQSRFIRDSKSQANMLGLSDPAQVVGKTDFDFFPHAQQAYEEEQEVMRSGQPLIDFEEYLVWPDGRETWVSTTKLPLRNSEGQTIGIFGISRDITERKQAEQAIRQLNASLEKKTAQLEAANQELEAFSYSVSHDLRAPLRAIDGFSRILLEDYEPILDEEGKRVCRVISKEAQHLGQLIDDLLAFSRLGRKEIHSTKIDMKAMASSVFNDLMRTEDAERIDFHIHKLPPTTGDPTLIRQAWVNLLSNAVKFSSKKERAVIEVGSSGSKDENIYYIRDNGAGFEREYVDKLFGVFQRLHGEKEFEGTGVGLAIVKRVINRHGGRVWAEGEVDKGATFYFALPRKRA
jgi:PAS domain S-box-containing protein